MSQHDFLVELGTEELPPKALKTLSGAFLDGITAGLDAAGIGYVEARPFAAPRRLAVLLTGIELQQPDREIEKRGPATQAPEKAVQGFAGSCGVSIDQLEVMETPKGSYYVYRGVEKGQSTASLLPSIISESLNKLPIPKRMRWGSSRTEFVRPVKWLVMLLGDEVVEAEILGLNAGRKTRGHRFHYNHDIELIAPADYPRVLKETGKVIADFTERRELIREQVIREGERIGGIAQIDEDLLDEVTALNEWPVALTGRFEERFLDVPAEALILSMKENQKYFHALDASGKLMPYFITLANIESKDPQQVIEGNEKVIRPRLADAAFFFETDKKQPLDARIEKLKSIVFQQQLGTVYDKTQRIEGLAASIAELINGDANYARRAAALSKCDLMTDMVFEFTELQGLMGYHYALHDGEPEEVAQAMNEQYMPRFAGDELPATRTGIALAIADRLDTLTGLFGINQPPTGSKDPFALRRAALGVLRIIVEHKLDLDLHQLLTLAAEQHGDLPGSEGLADRVLDFMLDRFRAWYDDRGISAETFLAVHVLRPTSPLDFDRRIDAVSHFRNLAEAESLAAANKRVSNILSKQEGDISTEVNDDLLQEEAEKALASALLSAEHDLQPVFEQGDYRTALERLASLREVIDSFFDNVMVMADDEAVRTNRLALLKRLRRLFLGVADISLLG
ncbi:glycine--tRNA ligase subunit beta [Marinobacterium sediminicola]|uniref:Glycine--tRNA ligase beta subunit n=1 Tax=Marinobacterium sediminicola TaxID=518898 RepID=A0ABY1S316_9GAMM|nr:glycine--tRNA ligase subunit beta [Marinobacterium sediminicola]ULG69242.1 glycine--tRNA ligase subunit beta [Marinobacterium sediminicola]SMR77590.1 glycyl-tRNA synthetase beta chain [Marinobacterium sediminicola]